MLTQMRQNSLRKLRPLSELEEQVYPENLVQGEDYLEDWLENSPSQAS